MLPVPEKPTRTILDKYYQEYNVREMIHPDPLEFLYLYDDPRDREIVGLIASSLAYGRVSQILKSVDAILKRLGPQPFNTVVNCKTKTLNKMFHGFRHRFTTGDQVAALLTGVADILANYGSLESYFLACSEGKEDITFLPAISLFTEGLRLFAGENIGSFLIPSAHGGSACKRINLFLRWMIRGDRVDPGVWINSDPKKLIIPLDTHMHRIAIRMGFTSRTQADMKTALEVTQAFRFFSPSDPVKYDFSLTRLGIRKNLMVDKAVFVPGSCG